jgi:hypothetical protein
MHVTGLMLQQTSYNEMVRANQALMDKIESLGGPQVACYDHS